VLTRHAGGLLKVGHLKDCPEQAPAARFAVRASVRAALAATSLAICAADPVAAAEVSRRPQPIGLTVAILDLAEAPGLAPVAPREPTRPAWRTSFGSERQTEIEKKAETGKGPLAALANSDAVLIQGVKSAAPLRRLFPPRTWRLIVSHRIVTSEDTANAVVASEELPAATAIAVKARKSLRVTARARALRLDEPPASTASDNDSPDTPVTAPTSPTSLPATSATAVRLVERGRTLWLASVALPASCGASPSAQCPARAELEAWRSAKRGAGEATLVGGRLAEKNTTTPTAETPQACMSHGIVSDLKSEIVPHDEVIPLSQTSTGCISIVRVGG
jgi:hypothetical protein